MKTLKLKTGLKLDSSIILSSFYVALVQAIKERATSPRFKKESHIVINISNESNPKETKFHAVYLSDINKRVNSNTFNKDKNVNKALTKEVKKGKITIYIPCPCGCAGHELAFFSINGGWTYGICPV